MIPIAYLYILPDGAALTLCPNCFTGGDCDGELYSATSEAKCSDCGVRIGNSTSVLGRFPARKWFVSVDRVVVVDAVKRQSMMTFREAQALRNEMRVTYPEFVVTMSAGWGL